MITEKEMNDEAKNGTKRWPNGSAIRPPSLIAQITEWAQQYGVTVKRVGDSYVCWHEYRPTLMRPRLFHRARSIDGLTRQINLILDSF